MNSRKARKKDPITSHLAAASTSESNLTGIKKQVSEIFRTGLHLTDEELVKVFSSNGYLGSPQGIRTARVELARSGKLEIVGIGKTQYNRKARIWAVIL